MHKILPKDWKLSYANTLGEFELLQLFLLHNEVQVDPDTVAAGWDGCRFEAYEDKNGRLVLLGSSIWDSERDAEEFCEGFTKVLSVSRPRGNYEVAQRSARVSFMVGTGDRNLRGAVLSLLSVER